MRCLTLAREIHGRGADIVFLTNEEAFAVVPALASSPFDVEVVAGGAGAVAEALGRRWHERTDLLVLDHYDWRAADETILREAVDRIIVIDDLADRPHDCDMLVDVNLGREARDYAGLVPDGTAMKIGPRYAPIRREFVAARPAALARRAEGGTVRRILVSLGLTDLNGITLDVVNALRGAGISHHLDIVLGPVAPSLAALRALNDPALDLYVAPQDMASLLARADLAVGAGGSSGWERCALGLPAVVLVLADNQRAGTTALAAAGAAVMLEANDLAALGAPLLSLINDQEARRRMSAAAAAVYDGAGAARIATALLSPVVDIRVRSADVDDATRLWEWRNDPAARAMSHDGRAIPLADHMAWYDRALASADRAILIGEVDGIPVGMVRFDGCGAAAFGVSIMLDPHMKGRSMGRPLLKAAIQWLRNDRPVDHLQATARDVNVASAKLFEACGFSISPPEQGWFHMNWIAASHG